MSTSIDKPLKREPKQERSRQVVDAILGGATRILMRAKLNEATTNRIAEAAGVGIGSLYDYFPNKNAIVTSLIDRRIASITADFLQLLRRNPEASLEEKVDEVADFLKEEFVNPKSFLHEIFLLAPETGRMKAIYECRVASAAAVASYLRGKRPALKVREAELLAFMTINGVMGIVETFVLTDSTSFTAEDLVAELRAFLLYQVSR